MTRTTKALFEAISDLKIDRIMTLLEHGCDLDETNDQGDTPLDWIIDMYESEEDRFAVVEQLLRAGANVNRRSPDSHGYGVLAIIQQDLRLLKLLLEHGYDPNLEPIHGESAYDWAVTDYIIDHWEEGFPENPTDNDRASEDRFLTFLERVAKKYQVAPPMFVRELRQGGALSFRELEDYGMI